MAKTPRVPVENQITTLSVVKIAIKVENRNVQMLFYSRKWLKILSKDNEINLTRSKHRHESRIL